MSPQPLASLSPASPSVCGDNVGLSQRLTQQQSCSWAHVSRMKTSSRTSPGRPWCPHSLPALRRMPAKGGRGWTRTDGRDAGRTGSRRSSFWARDTLQWEHGSRKNQGPSPCGPALLLGELVHGCPRTHELKGVPSDCPQTIYNSWRLEAPRRPSHRPGPLTGTQLPIGTRGGVQEQTYHGDSRKDPLPTPPGGQLSRVGLGRNSAVSFLCSKRERQTP